MKWLKENWFRVGLLIILILSVAGAFNWYGLRPSNIKKDCYVLAGEKAIEKAGTATTDRKFSKDDFDTYYKWCLEKNGL